MAASGLHACCAAVGRVRPHPRRRRCTSAPPSRPEEGTWIREDPAMEQAIISGIAHKSDEAKVTLTGVPDKPGPAASIFTAVAAAHLNVDTIIQNVVRHGVADVSFSIPTDSSRRYDRHPRGPARRPRPALTSRRPRSAKVTLVGAGMKSDPGVAAKMFRTLADHGHQHPDDRDLADQGLVRHRPRRSPRAVARPARRLRPASEAARRGRPGPTSRRGRRRHRRRRAEVLRCSRSATSRWPSFARSPRRARRAPAWASRRQLEVRGSPTTRSKASTSPSSRPAAAARSVCAAGRRAAAAS